MLGTRGRAGARTDHLGVLLTVPTRSPTLPASGLYWAGREKGPHMRVRQGGVTSRQIGSETILLDFESSQYLTVNGTGTVLLRMLSEDRERGELVAAICEEYDVESDVAERD